MKTQRVIRGTCLAAAFLLAFGPGRAMAGETPFFSLLGDVPVMTGLHEMPEDNISFDKPEGRIVETAAAGEIKNSNEISVFYATTLPQLGWAPAGPGRFTRDGEVLTLRIEVKKPLNIVHFSLFPQE